MKNFKVIDFRFASKDDKYDEKYFNGSAWSRPYEYKYVIDNINSKKNVKIHNTSWGFEGVHVIFRKELDKLSETLHSDIIDINKEHKSFIYNIVTENKEFEEEFDYVLNVSTIEHLKSQEDRLKAIKNLWKQVKPNGRLILTFDYPRVNLEEIENLINLRCLVVDNKLNGKNSIVQNLTYEHLNIVYLVLEKTS